MENISFDDLLQKVRANPIKESKKLSIDNLVAILKEANKVYFNKDTLL